MKSYLESTLNCNVKLQDNHILEKLPLYLKTEYSYVFCEIMGIDCIIAYPKDFKPVRYSKHRAKLEQLTRMKVVILLDRITPYQRKALIEENIPFIVNGSQIYLPFMAVILCEKYESAPLNTEKFTPITQLVFLYTLYNGNNFTAAEIASVLNCTAMSASRAYKALTDSGLFKIRRDCNKKYLITEKSRAELLSAAGPYLINPVERVIYCENKNKPVRLLAAGEQALADKTMITYSTPCYAVSKKTASEITAVDEEYYQTMGGIRIEVWKYDSKLLSCNNVVDDISLILSLQDENDERILTEIEKLRRKYE